MKWQMMAVALCVSCAVGCMTSDERPNAPPHAKFPSDVENVPVVVSQNQDLRSAVVLAAMRRRWIPQEVDATTVRCTLTRRAHKVVIDVRLLNERHYSIRTVESDVPAKKVAKWVASLQREIAKSAVSR